MRPLLRLTATAALLALSQPVLAQGSCGQQEDVADAATYAMPLVIEALQSRCTEVLPANSFIMNEGADLSAEFEPLRDSAWPGARRLQRPGPVPSPRVTSAPAPARRSAKPGVPDER